MSRLSNLIRKIRQNSNRASIASTTRGTQSSKPKQDATAPAPQLTVTESPKTPQTKRAPVPQSTPAQKKGWSKYQSGHPKYPHLFAADALEAVLQHCDFNTVLDVGSGSGDHSVEFEKAGKFVTSIDFGRSVYYQQKSHHRAEIKADYLTYQFDKPFDLVWASHVLEHQLNPNLFLKKVHQDLQEGGWLAITVPPLKHEIVGGHVTLWNAGLLLYNLVVAGFNCKAAAVKKYNYNISVVVQKESIPELPELHYDSGDIDRLAAYFPDNCSERFDGNIQELNWNWRAA